MDSFVLYKLLSDLQVLQDCFESKDIQQLQDSLTAMPEEEARYHLNRCINSGLWVPDAGRAAALAAEKDTTPKVPTEDDEVEEVYDELTH